MKKLFYLLGFIVMTVGPAGAQGVFLGTGESYTYSFADLPFLHSGGLNDSAVATIYFSGNLLDAGEQVQLDLFENEVSTTGDLTAWGDGPRDYFRFGAGAGFWTDRAGAIRVSMVSGSVQLSQLSFEVTQGGSVYGETVIVPEPGVVALWIVGSLLVAGQLLRRRLGRAK